jgi:hypothetical protein
MSVVYKDFLEFLDESCYKQKVNAPHSRWARSGLVYGWAGSWTNIIKGLFDSAVNELCKSCEMRELFEIYRELCVIEKL